MGRVELLERCFKVPPLGLKPLFDETYELSRRLFSDVIHFYVPGMAHFDTSFYRTVDPYRFPGISVTGSGCRLNCEHCKGKLLEGMISATTPQRLFEVCMKIKRAEGEGCLVSGGCMEDGSVPLMDYIPVIKRVKQELGLFVVVHSGLIYPLMAEALADAGVDAVMIDVIGSDETMRDVYHLNCGVNSIDRSLSLLEKNRIPIVPHILVGIHYGQLRGEKRALQIVSKHNPAAVVIIALIPLHHTPMEKVDPPSPLDVARVILASRLTMPNTPLLLGCARPMGTHKVKTDVLAIRAGVNGIAFPSEEAFNLARKLELQVRFHEECCSLLWRSLSYQAKPY